MGRFVRAPGVRGSHQWGEFQVSSESKSSGAGGAGRPREIFGYEVLDFLGKGAGSTLYAVSHPQTKQVYALKHVQPQNDREQRFVEQLEAEHEVGHLVNHPGLRRSLDLKVSRTMLRKVSEAALVLELFDGAPLERRLPKSLRDVVSVFVQTAEAIAALHQLGYVHCDLKPNNILRDRARRVKVIDLGQACRVNTVKQRIQGTPDYIAPEQVKCEAATPRTDVYNLGATLYWALCGKTMPTLFTIKRGANSFLLDERIPTPKDENPLVPEPLSNLVMECVRVNPVKRPDLSDVLRRLQIVQHILHRDNDHRSARPLEAAVA